MAIYSYLTKKLRIGSNRPRCERVLESIIFNNVTEENRANTVKGFLVKASEMVCQIINTKTSETAMRAESEKSKQTSEELPEFDSERESGD